ncbi:hypothetical protein CRE_25286 [Caenorhabditis remanei]|uniref:Uncharacterized protein n=1 Tax=Caenorhabditis remanei TaxID=31234 RepID=E3LSC1_CAERE|nr:hypothetical protein CRE_25286 [Caenorhabditis remanei]
MARDSPDGQDLPFFRSTRYPFLHRNDHISVSAAALIPLFAWTLRLIHSHLVLIEINTAQRRADPESRDLGPIKQSPIHISLNMSAVILFALLAYFSDGKMGIVFEWMAIFETLMTICYIFNNSWIMLLHFVFQAMIFSIIFSTSCLPFAYRFDTSSVTSLLESYGLNNVIKFCKSHSFFATTVLSTVWFLRMMITHIFLIEVATDDRVHRRKTKFTKLIQQV